MEMICKTLKSISAENLFLKGGSVWGCMKKHLQIALLSNQNKHLQIALLFLFPGSYKVKVRSWKPPLFLSVYFEVYVIWPFFCWNKTPICCCVILCRSHCLILFTSSLVLGIFRLDPSYLFDSFWSTFSQVVVVIKSWGDDAFIFRPSLVSIIYV